MDQDLGPRTELSDRPRGDSRLAVSSRRQALDRLQAAALAGQARPILITGEPGAGKTWLANQLYCVLPTCWRLARVDLTRAMTALDFLQLIGHSLGAPLAEGLGTARARLDSILCDDDFDGRRCLLIVDEAHRGNPAVWDEIQALANQLGRPGGFAALLVLGDTELVRAFATRGFGAFASSLCFHFHLAPLDLDEARELMALTGQAHVAADAVEEMHRDARGNAGRLLRLAQRRPAPWRLISDLAPDRESRDVDTAWPSFPSSRTRNSTDPDQPETLDTAPTAAESRVATTHLDHLRAETPALLPSKPPIRVEDGLVEVGWDGDLNSELGEPEETTIITAARLADDSTFNEELIEDRYAALQAWGEWTESQKRTASRGVATENSAPRRSPEPSSLGDSPPPDEPTGSLEASPATTPSGIRIEPQHDFAPYSQLFTRTRQSKQP
jgi:type II secretory pathway predicted ATPase ExeA